nr:hypothetical protein [uncultured Prevotella sp.]
MPNLIYNMVGMPRTQLNTECSVFTFGKGNASRRYRHFSSYCKTSVCTHKLRSAPLDKQSGRLDRNHSVLIGHHSEIKQQQIIHND